MKAYKVQFLAPAVTDLDDLYSFISQRSSFQIADNYLARIEQFCLSLSTFPERGTAIRGSLPSIRSMGFERRVTILFRVREETVEILRILYGGRDWRPLIESLPGS